MSGVGRDGGAEQGENESGASAARHARVLLLRFEKEFILENNTN